MGPSIVEPTRRHDVARGRFISGGKTEDRSTHALQDRRRFTWACVDEIHHLLSVLGHVVWLWHRWPQSLAGLGQRSCRIRRFDGRRRWLVGHDRGAGFSARPHERGFRFDDPRSERRDTDVHGYELGIARDGYVASKHR